MRRKQNKKPIKVQYRSPDDVEEAEVERILEQVYEIILAKALERWREDKKKA